MKAYILPILCVLAIANITRSQDLVQNGDFEETSPEGLAEGWTYTPSEILKVVKDDAGNHYLRLIKNEEKWFTGTQLVELRGGPKQLMLKARMKVKDFKRNETQTWKCPKIGVQFIIDSDDGPARRKEKGIHLTKDTGDDWVYMYKMVPVPRSAMQVELMVVNEASGGEIHFDDISIVLDPADKMLSREIINTAGNFEVRTDEEKPIYGYRAYRGDRVRIPEEGGNSYISITGYRNKTTSANTVMRLDPAWKKLKVSCRIRSSDLEIGFSPSHTVKLVMTLVDGNEKDTGKWISPLKLKKDSSEWKEMSGIVTIDDKAKGLLLSPTIDQCDGVGQFDDIKVEVVE
jgi:hypothetical protein